MRTQFGLHAAEYFARFHRLSWKEAFGMVAGAPFRLHHYRDLRTQMLHDALCDIDCGSIDETVRDE